MSRTKDPITKKVRPKIAKAYWLKREYGISIEEYEDLLDEYNHKCGVCLSPNKLCVDHDHANGRVRGILCSDCNMALGLLKDNPTSILKLYQYLRISRYLTSYANS